MIRAFELRRLSMIGDSVFAVSITLNARAVPVTRLTVDAWGTTAFVHFVEGVGAVLLSVIVASAFWLGHWRYFRHVRTTGPGLIAAHFCFLLALILLPVSTDLFALNRLNATSTVVYGLNLLMLTLVALLFRLAAIRHTPGRVVVTQDWAGLAGVIALFSVALFIAPQSPEKAQWCWYVGLASPLIETWLGRRIAKRFRHGWAGGDDASTGAVPPDPSASLAAATVPVARTDCGASPALVAGRGPASAPVPSKDGRGR